MSYELYEDAAKGRDLTNGWPEVPPDQLIAHC
jgi:hypothetical protein